MILKVSFQGANQILLYMWSSKMRNNSKPHIGSQRKIYNFEDSASIM